VNLNRVALLESGLVQTANTFGLFLAFCAFIISWCVLAGSQGRRLCTLQHVKTTRGLSRRCWRRGPASTPKTRCDGGLLWETAGRHARRKSLWFLGSCVITWTQWCKVCELATESDHGRFESRTLRPSSVLSPWSVRGREPGVNTWAPPGPPLAGAAQVLPRELRC
jgi:hypothetical protein